METDQNLVIKNNRKNGNNTLFNRGNKKSKTHSNYINKNQYEE